MVTEAGSRCRFLAVQAIRRLSVRGDATGAIESYQRVIQTLSRCVAGHSSDLCLCISRIRLPLLFSPSPKTWHFRRTCDVTHHIDGHRRKASRQSISQKSRLLSLPCQVVDRECGFHHERRFNGCPMAPPSQLEVGAWPLLGCQPFHVETRLFTYSFTGTASGHSRVSCPDRPMLNFDLGHGKVIDVCRGKSRTNTGSRGRYQAVGLMQGDAIRSKRSAP